MALVRIAEGVFQSDKPPVILERQDIDRLREDVKSTKLGRSRYLIHQASTDPVHEMIIAQADWTYVRPHKHSGKTESCHIIEGEMDIVLFDESGEIFQVVRLAAPGGSAPFYMCVPENTFLTQIVRSPVVILHETIKGPFVKSEAEFAPWSPPEDDLEAVVAYRERLDIHIQAARNAE